MPLWNLEYLFCAPNMQKLGIFIGNILQRILINEFGQIGEQIHSIGHSLGGHLAGFISRTMSNTGNQIGRVTGKKVTHKCFGHTKMFFMSRTFSVPISTLCIS